MNTTYRNMTFSTPLVTRWAAFFDLAGWTWHTNAKSVGNWAPDFFVSFPCEHSECSGSHELLASVLPFANIDDFKDHPCMQHEYGTAGSNIADGMIGVDGGAALGMNPSVSQWVISHGSGGGLEDIYLHFGDSKANELWERARLLIDTEIQVAK